MPGGKLRCHHRPKRPQHSACQISVLRPRDLCVDQPAQQMHAHTEVPLPRPTAGAIQLPLIALLSRKPLCQIRAQRCLTRPIGKERASNHRIKHTGITRQMRRKCGRCGDDINQQIRKLRIGVQKREELHARRQSGQKAIKGQKRLLRFRRLRQTGQQLWFQLFKDLRPALRAQSRIAMPALDDLCVKTLRLHHRLGRRFGGSKKAFRDLMHIRQPTPQIGLQHVNVQVHHRRQPRKPLVRAGQRVGLGISHHLQAMFHRPVRHIVIGQRLCRFRWHPILFCQHRQALTGPPDPQVRIPPARNQLPRLGEKLDLPDAAAPQLHIMPRQRDRPRQPLMLADRKTHVMGVLDRGKVQVLAPDKGAQCLHKPLPRRQIPRTGPRLDIGRPLPGPPQALVIPLRCLHRDADRCDRRIGTQTQIGAKHIAIPGQIAQRTAHAAGGFHKGGAGLKEIVWIKPRLIKEADQIDVRGIIQLIGPHLAHGEHGHPRRIRQIILCHPRHLAPRQQRGQPCPQGRAAGRIGKPGEHAGHLRQRPGTPQISNRRHQRHAPLGLTQPCGQIRSLRLRRLRDDLLHRRRRIGLRGHQPLRFFLQQPHQIRRRRCRGCDQLSHLWRRSAQQRRCILRPCRIEHARSALDEGGEAACHAPSFAPLSAHEQEPETRARRP